jgi:hypothetical protein
MMQKRPKLLIPFFSSQSNIDDTDKSVPADDTPPPRCLDRIVLNNQKRNTHFVTR